MALLEVDDDYDQEDFRRRLSQVKEEIITIRAAMEDDQDKIQALQEAKANNEAFWEFARSNQSWLAGLREQLNDLAPEDKKLLIESLVPEKISVCLTNLEEGETGPPWGIGNFNFSFNSSIFEGLSSESKLEGLDKNDRDHFSFGLKKGRKPASHLPQQPLISPLPSACQPLNFKMCRPLDIM